MNVLTRVYRFYYEGFRDMTVGKTLWLIIILKVAVMFLVLKLFFFPNFLNSKTDTPKEKGDYVIEQLTAPVK